MDFLKRLEDYIEGLSFTPSTIHIGLYNENGNSVAIRPSPSNIDDRDMEGGKSYHFSFQILVHHESNTIAYDLINQLTSELDNLSSESITSSNESFKLVTMECTTTPNFVQRTSRGVLWTAIYNAELYIQGGNE